MKKIFKETQREIVAIIICILLIICLLAFMRYKNRQQTINTTSSNASSTLKITSEHTTTMMSTTSTTTSISTTASDKTHISADSLAELQIDSATIDRIAGICYGEARGSTYTEICKVVWCICNRADAWNQTLWEISTAPNQFYYVTNLSYRSIVVDVLNRWLLEKQGVTVIRELEKDYLYFTGDGKMNYYRTSY